MSTFIIAEAGVNHNGSLDMALRLVEIASNAGADAVKFQTFKAETLVLPGAPKAEYQIKQTGSQGDQFSMVRALELSHEAHEALFKRCRELNIEFMSTAFDVESAEFLARLGMHRVKIPSGELTNRPFIEFLAKQGKPMILSTGMASLDEVADAVGWIEKALLDAGLQTRLQDCLTLLHCTSNYPTALEDVNLRALQTLSERFGLPVGYSDHTAGTRVASLAVAMGATVIEKHFTLDRSLPGPDHQASLEPVELEQMVAEIRATELLLGDGVKQPRASELPVRALVRRSVTLLRAVSAGQALTRADLGLLRPGTGIAPESLEEVVGRRVRDAVPAGHTLAWEDLLP